MIVLPLPISVNSAYGGGSKQRRFKTKEYVAWLKKCPKLQALKLSPVELTYTFYFPNNRASDIGNREKVTTDYLVSQQVIPDDDFNHVKRIVLIFGGIDREKPRVEINVTRLEQAE